MANVNTPLASSLHMHQHIVDLVETTRQYLADVEPKLCMPYMVDICDASLLPILAKQFDVLGRKGYDLAITELDKRELVKNAIYLHSIKGTPYSIRLALESLGYNIIQIIEGEGAELYDGERVHNGLIYYSSGGNWAYFSVIVDIQLNGISSSVIAYIKEMIDIYKAKRCVLRSVSYQQSLTEKVTLRDNEPEIIFFS